MTFLSKVLECIVAIVFLYINGLLPPSSLALERITLETLLDRFLSDLYGAMDVSQICLSLSLSLDHLRCQSAQLFILLTIIYSFNAFLLFWADRKTNRVSSLLPVRAH